jgi:hypothetical protein
MTMRLSQLVLVLAQYFCMEQGAVKLRASGKLDKAEGQGTGISVADKSEGCR